MFFSQYDAQLLATTCLLAKLAVNTHNTQEHHTVRLNADCVCFSVVYEFVKKNLTQFPPVFIAIVLFLLLQADVT